MKQERGDRPYLVNVTTGPVGGRSPGRNSIARLLVVDDDEDLRRMLVSILSQEGYEVDQAPDASAAQALLARRRPDLLLLDIMMPEQDGLELLSTLRAKGDVPVILLTGRGNEADRVLGLKMGADDYVVKPFSAAELAARISSVLRRSRPRRPSATLSFDALVIDTTSREVRLAGQPVELTAKEFDLLSHLASWPRQVFSRDQLLREVWESSADWQDSSTVTEHVRRVRRKIEADPDNPRWIHTVRGVGYRFEP